MKVRSNSYNRGVAQLVARVVWDHEAVGSSPTTPTRKFDFFFNLFYNNYRKGKGKYL